MTEEQGKPATPFAAGIALGALVLGLVLGLSLQGLWPSVPLHASATQGHENFAIATGLVDNSVEAIYFLDFLTGDLKAAVINPKTQKFSAVFARNITGDFSVGKTKNPKYLMVTGLANMPRGRQQYSYGQSIIYLAEANSGEVAAYSIEWNQAAMSRNQPQTGNISPLDKMKFRTVQVRD